MTKVEMLHCFRVVQKQTGFKTHLTKGSFKITCHFDLREENAFHTLFALFVLNVYLYLLVHSFLPMAFIREMSFGSLAFSLSPFFE